MHRTTCSKTVIEVKQVNQFFDYDTVIMTPNQILISLMRYMKMQNHDIRLPNSWKCVLQVDCTQTGAWQYLQKKQQKLQSGMSL